MRAQRKLNQARTLRNNSTPAEGRLWEQLRNRQLERFKFVGQATVGPHMADFLNRERKLIVELDGWTHATPHEISHDQKRRSLLNAEGYGVIRFANDDARHGMDDCWF